MLFRMRVIFVCRFIVIPSFCCFVCFLEQHYSGHIGARGETRVRLLLGRVHLARVRDLLRHVLNH